MMQNACGVRELKTRIQIFTFEKIPTKIFKSQKGRKIELCFSCYEYETIKSKKTKTDFKKNLDLKYETLKILNI